MPTCHAFPAAPDFIITFRAPGINYFAFKIITIRTAHSLTPFNCNLNLLPPLAVVILLGLADTLPQGQCPEELDFVQHFYFFPSLDRQFTGGASLEEIFPESLCPGQCQGLRWTKSSKGSNNWPDKSAIMRPLFRVAPAGSPANAHHRSSGAAPEVMNLLSNRQGGGISPAARSMVLRTRLVNCLSTDLCRGDNIPVPVPERMDRTGSLPGAG